MVCNPMLISVYICDFLSVAVPLTTMTNLTSLYNTFAFWAYLLATRMLGEPATKWKYVLGNSSSFGTVVADDRPRS